MKVKENMTKLFKAIDGQDSAAFSSFLSKDARFQFGNMPETKGRDEIKTAIDQFFGSIDSLSHDIDNFWAVDDVVVVNGRVNYTRLDKSKLSVPFANVFKMDGKLIGEYQIYVDISDLYR